METSAWKGGELISQQNFFKPIKAPAATLLTNEETHFGLIKGYGTSSIVTTLWTSINHQSSTKLAKTIS